MEPPRELPGPLGLLGWSGAETCSLTSALCPRRGCPGLRESPCRPAPSGCPKGGNPLCCLAPRGPSHPVDLPARPGTTWYSKGTRPGAAGSAKATREGGRSWAEPPWRWAAGWKNWGPESRGCFPVRAGSGLGTHRQAPSAPPHRPAVGGPGAPRGRGG